MVSTEGLQGNDLTAKCVSHAAGADDCTFIRIRYSGPTEGAKVQAFGSTLAFYHYTQSTKFTLDTAVGGDGYLGVEQSNSGVATVSKAGQIVSLINAATYWVAWLDGAAYDTPVSSSVFVATTYGTADVSSSDYGAGVKIDSSVRKYHELSIGYLQKFTDVRATNAADADATEIARGPRINTAGDPDWQKQGHAELEGINVGKDTATGSTVAATLSVVAEKVSVIGTANRRTLMQVLISSLNGPTLVGTGVDYLTGDAKICAGPGERLIVRLESGDTPLGTFQLNVSGKWVPNPTIGA